MGIQETQIMEEVEEVEDLEIILTKMVGVSTLPGISLFNLRKHSELAIKDSFKTSLLHSVGKKEEMQERFQLIVQPITSDPLLLVMKIAKMGTISKLVFALKIARQVTGLTQSLVSRGSLIGISCLAIYQRV